MSTDTTKPALPRETLGRLILEASTGLHGDLAKHLADAWAEQAALASAAEARAVPAEALLREAADYLAELYTKYQRRIGPFASKGQGLNARIGAFLRAAPSPAEQPECERCGLSPTAHSGSHWCDNQSFRLPSGAVQLGATTPAEQPAQRPAGLSIARLNGIAREAQVAFCLGKFDSFEVAFARGVEEAHGIGQAPTTRHL